MPEYRCMARSVSDVGKYQFSKSCEHDHRAAAMQRVDEIHIPQFINMHSFLTAEFEEYSYRPFKSEDSMIFLKVP